MADEKTSASTDARPNLHQRIAAIAGKAEVKVTGRTSQLTGSRPALSIADVDRVLGELMAQHGVTSRYSFAEEPRSYEEPTRDPNKPMRIWRVHLWGILVNADEPGQEIRDELWDDGTNISGAVSFALKRWLRATFKLAEDDDTAQSQHRQQNQAEREASSSTPRNGRPADAGPYGNEGEDPRNDEVPAPPARGSKAAILELAIQAGKNKAWLDEQWEKYSAASIGKKLEQILMKRAQEGKFGPDEEPNPDALVCPACGKEVAARQLPEDEERMRCVDGLGGCNAEFAAASRPTRAEWDRLMKPSEPATEAEPTNV